MVVEGGLEKEKKKKDLSLDALAGLNNHQKGANIKTSNWSYYDQV